MGCSVPDIRRSYNGITFVSKTKDRGSIPLRRVMIEQFFCDICGEPVVPSDAEDAYFFKMGYFAPTCEKCLDAELLKIKINIAHRIMAEKDTQWGTP